MPFNDLGHPSDTGIDGSESRKLSNNAREGRGTVKFKRNGPTTIQFSIAEMKVCVCQRNRLFHDKTSKNKQGRILEVHVCDIFLGEKKKETPQCMLQVIAFIDG